MKKLHIWVIIVTALLLAASIGWGMLWYYSGQETVPEEVTAGGISIGGMSIDDALKLLDEYEKTLEQRTVKIDANAETSDSKQWTVSEIGYNAEFIGIRENLVKLRHGNLWERSKYRYHFPKTYELTQSFDRMVFDNLLRKQWGWIDLNEPMDASRTITDADKVVYVPHIDAYRINPEKLIDEVEPWIIVAEGKIGQQPEPSLTAELPIGIIHPKVTLQSLKDEGIDRKIFEFSTVFKTSSEGRAHNVTAAADALNEWHLAPGEVFEYGKVIAAAEKLYGFKEAPVILNGKLVPGIGGGICQVSSTLYNAILRTGLEIVERRNHSLPVAYLPIGQDATFADGAINFRFRNSTGKHLIIRTVVEDRKLTVKLFGTMPENIRYDIESNTVKKIASTIQRVTDKSLEAGKNVTVQEGRTGYVVETYRTLLRDDKVVSRERVSRDTYRAQPTIIHVGPGTSAPTATPSPSDEILEDGVSG
ncbi:MAG: VanW family protein [Candidatus Pristimantibacillus sp.]